MIILVFALALLSGVSLAETPPPALTGFPFQDETLQFHLSLPAGASLGEGRMQARRKEDGRWEFQLSLDASIPGLTIADRYRSVATADLCSVEFERDLAHGQRRSKEKITFAQDTHKAHRANIAGGGATDFPVRACAQDALTYIYFTRREMGQGRVPLPSTIVFGGPYAIRLVWPGPETVKGALTDRLAASVHGPSSNLSFDLMFARDAARTPVLIRVPLALGIFSLELTR
jgi:hypothetical protein